MPGEWRQRVFSERDRKRDVRAEERREEGEDAGLPEWCSGVEEPLRRSSAWNAGHTRARRRRSRRHVRARKGPESEGRPTRPSPLGFDCAARSFDEITPRDLIAA